MVKYNFKDSAEFDRLRKLAYDGQLDFNDFPAAEYRYFDRMQDIGYRSRHDEYYSREQAREACKKALCDYQDDIDTLSHNLAAAQQYLQSRLRMHELIPEIYKEHSPIAKLRLALQFVELTVNEPGLAERNMSSNYLNQEEK